MRPRTGLQADVPWEILLVDDNHHGLVARKALLQELGYTVTTASDGEEALQLFMSRKYDLVVTDHKMPGMSGSDLIRSLRHSQPGARIIMLSGFVEGLGLNEENTGADVVISKSAGEVPHLIRAVNRLLSGRVRRKPSQRQTGLNRPHISRA